MCRFASALFLALLMLGGAPILTSLSSAEEGKSPASQSSAPQNSAPQNSAVFSSDSSASQSSAWQRNRSSSKENCCIAKTCCR
jgi:hypothetical protein